MNKSYSNVKAKLIEIYQVGWGLRARISIDGKPRAFNGTESINGMAIQMMDRSGVIGMVPDHLPKRRENRIEFSVGQEII